MKKPRENSSRAIESARTVTQPHRYATKIFPLRVWQNACFLGSRAHCGRGSVGSAILSCTNREQSRVSENAIFAEKNRLSGWMR
jgi:hypothetical protein